MPLVLLVVLLILLLLLRSVVAPLVLMVTVVASFLAVMGASYWASTTSSAYPGVDEYVPLFVFIFLVALGVDYNIFLMARVREEAVDARRARRHATRADRHRWRDHVGRRGAGRNVLRDGGDADRRC